jgi:hypothetical protein
MEGGSVVWINGMGIVYDPAGWRPAPGTLPQIIQCRKCKNTYGYGIEGTSEVSI